jgi:Caspase domain
MLFDLNSSDASAFAKSIYAVVIGVGEYVSSSEGKTLSNLPECITGAKSLEAVLVDGEKCRIPKKQVTLLTKPCETTKDSMLKALRSAALAATPGAALFVYYAGHGLEMANSFYLATVDTPPRPTADTAISAQDLAEVLAGTLARGILIVVDCCGGAALAERAPLVFSVLGDQFDYRILLSASKRGQSSWEFKGEGSPFTNLFIKALSGGLPTIGKRGEIYFSTLLAFLTNEMEKLFSGRLAGLKKQEPKAEVSAGPDPLVFVNSDISLESVRLHLARFSIKDLRQRLVGISCAVAGIAIAVALGIWTWLDQHTYAQFRADGVELLNGYPGWQLLEWYPKPLWGFNFPRSEIDAQSLLGRSKPLVMLKQDDPTAAIANNLTEIGRAKFAAQLGRNVEAATAARLILRASGISKDVGYDAKDIIIASAAVGDGASIADLAGDEKLVATRVLQRIAIIDSNLFEQMLASEQTRDPNRFDQEQVFPFVAATCSGQISAYVDRLFGKEWSFTPYTADLIARTRCVTALLTAKLDWNHVTASQAYLRRLLMPPQEDHDLIGGFEQFVAELLAGTATKGFDIRRPSARLGSALDAAVAFDRPSFGCSQNLMDLLRKFSESPDSLASEGANVAAYFAKYCRGQGIKASGESELEIDVGAGHIAVPLRTLDANTILALESVAPATIMPLVTYQFAVDLRDADKLELIFATPDLPASIKLLENAAGAPDEDVQAAALLWVFHHRRADLVPMMQRLGSRLLDQTILRISVPANTDQAAFAALKSYALITPSRTLRTCWTTMWGALEEAVDEITKPSVQERRNAFECLSFRNDLRSIHGRVAAASNPYYTDVLAHIDRAILEHNRLFADMAAIPAPLKAWRAGIDYTETFGGKLVLISSVPGLDLRLRETIKFGPLSRHDNEEGLVRPVN